MEWSGGTAASSEERKVKAMQPLWKCNLSSSSNLKTHVKRERGAFPIGLLSKARMTAVTHCEVLGRGSLTLSTSTSTPLDFTNSTFHSFPRPKSAALIYRHVALMGGKRMERVFGCIGELCKCAPLQSNCAQR